MEGFQGSGLCGVSPRVRLRRTMLTAFMFGVSIPSLAWAQDDGAVDVGVDEILVTAQKRTENLQDTPLAITAISERSLEVRSATDVSAVAGIAPNVQFQGSAPLSGGSFNATVFIRGVGQNDFSVFNDPGVGIYLDGIYLGRTTGSILELADIERVEVLRGPQGTLFGKNAVGGAINVISKAPTEKLEGKVSATVGNFHRVDVSGVISGPIVEDKLLARLSLGNFTRDGYVERLTDGEDLGDKNVFGGKLQVRALLGDSLTLDLAGDMTRIRQNSAALVLLNVANSGTPFLNLFNSFVAPTTGILAPDGNVGINTSFLTGNPRTTWASGPNINDLDQFGTSAVLTWDVADNLTIKSLTAYRALDAEFGRDGDNTPYNFRHTQDVVDQNQFSQELQLIGDFGDGKIEYAVGAFYLHEKAEDLARITLAEGLAQHLPTYNPGLDLVFDQFVGIRTKSYAGYANARMHFSDRLSATLGIRYTHESKRMEAFERRISAQSVTAGTEFLVNPAVLETLYGAYPLKEDWNDWSPRFGLEYKPNDDLMLYGSVSKGFKSGSFNGRATANEQEIAPFDPEIVWNYEAGIKSEFFDRKLTFNLAGFYMDYSDIQITVNRTPSNFVVNGGKAEIYGAELEFAARPSRNLRIDGSVGYLHSRYTELSPPNPAFVIPFTADSHLVRSPRWTSNLGAEYTADIGGGELSLRGDLSYISKQFYDAANTPLISQDGYALLSARIAYTTADDGWTVALSGTNLTDKLYLVSGNAASPAFGSLVEGSYGRPREVALSVTKRF